MKDKRAYELARDAMDMAYEQGARGEPLSGLALAYTETSDKLIAQGQFERNTFKVKYQRGLDGLPFTPSLQELEPSNLDKNRRDHG